MVTALLAREKVCMGFDRQNEEYCPRVGESKFCRRRWVGEFRKSEVK